MQAFSRQIPTGLQLFKVGGAFYYVTLASVGSPSFTNDLQVWKSLDEINWTLQATLPATGPPTQTAASLGAPAAVAGTIIYAALLVVDSTSFPSNAYIVLARFDTVAGVFLSNSARSAIQTSNPAVTNTAWCLSATNAGTLILMSIFAAPIATGMFFQVYTPGSNSWASPVQVTTVSAVPIFQIHDTVSDLTFCFNVDPAAGDILRCATIATDLSFTETIVGTFIGTIANVELGIAGIVNGFPGGDLIVYPFTGGTSGLTTTLEIARATIAPTPSWSIDIVQDGTGLPAGKQVEAFDNSPGGAWVAFGDQGFAYVAYAVNNGDPQGGSSQSFLYYQFLATLPGSWSTPTLLFTSAVPGELMIPYETAGSVLILVTVADPTTWPAITSLTFFTLGSPVVVTLPTIKYINQAGLFPLPLPDPAKC